MAKDNSLEKFERGEALSSEKMNKLRQLAQDKVMVPGVFTTNGFTVARTLFDQFDEVVVTTDAPIDAATISPSFPRIITPGQGAVTICEKQSDGTWKETNVQETLYNFASQVVESEANSGALKPMLVHRNLAGQLVIYEIEGEGEPGPPGANGGGTGVFYRLKENLGLNDQDALAEALGASGNPIADALVVALTVANEAARLALVAGSGPGEVEVNDIVEQTAPGLYYQFLGGDPSDPNNWLLIITDLYIYDVKSTLEAYGPYTNAQGDSEDGFLGTGYVFTYNYNATGLPGAIPDSLENFAERIIVRLNENIVGAGPYVPDLVIPAFGHNWVNRLPPEFTQPAQTGGGNITGVSVDDRFGSANGAKKGEYWYADLLGTGTLRRYVFTNPARDFCVIRGQAVEDLEGTGLLTIQNINAVVGPKLVTEPTVVARADVRVKIETGDEVYAFYDRSITTDENADGWPDVNRQWRLTAAFNIDQFLKGYVGFFDHPEAEQWLKQEGGDVLWSSDLKPLTLFELIQDKALSDTERNAKVVNPETGALEKTIVVSDQLQQFHGLSEYTDVEGGSQDGFQGAAFKFINSANQERYHMVAIEHLQDVIVVRFTGVPGTEVGPHEVDFIRGFVSHKLPKGVATKMNVYNTYHWADNTDGQEQDWLCGYDKLTNQYELLIEVGPKPPSEFAYVLITTQISAGTVSGSGIIPSPGTGALLEKSGSNYVLEGSTVDVLNMTENAYRGSASEPVAPLCRRNEDGKYEIVDKDMRSLPSYDATKPQEIWHDASGQYEWKELCVHDMVTEVLIDAGQLKYKYHAYNDCTEVEVVIADIGPCD